MPESRIEMKSIHRNLIFFLACHFLPFPSVGLIRFDLDSNSKTPNFRIQILSVSNSFGLSIVESDVTSLISTEFHTQDVYETTSEYEVEDDREKELTGHDFYDPATKITLSQGYNAANLLKYDSSFVFDYVTFTEVLRC